MTDSSRKINALVDGREKQKYSKAKPTNNHFYHQKSYNYHHRTLDLCSKKLIINPSAYPCVAQLYLPYIWDRTVHVWGLSFLTLDKPAL
jgi:hypothetical protein